VEVVLMAASKRQQKVVKPIAPLRVKVKFLKNCDPGNGKPVFKAGSIHGLVISSANHWVRRGMAEKYVEKPQKAKPAKAKATTSRGRRRKVTVKAQPATVETESIVVENADEEILEAGLIVEEEVNEETPDEENADGGSATEGKKTEDGESFGGMDDLMD